MFLRKSFHSTRFSRNLYNSHKNSHFCRSDGNVHRYVTVSAMAEQHPFPIHSKWKSASGRLNTLPGQAAAHWHRQNQNRKFQDPLFVLNPLSSTGPEIPNCKQNKYFYVFPFLISHNRGILVSFKIKLEIKDNLSCYCLSVKDIIFGRQIPRTILTVQITVGSMQRMKIDFSFPKGVSTHGHIKLKGLKQKVPFTSSWYNSCYLKEIF